MIEYDIWFVRKSDGKVVGEGNEAEMRIADNNSSEPLEWIDKTEGLGEIMVFKEKETPADS